jgi:protein-tyrosine phosphatase
MDKGFSMNILFVCLGNICRSPAAEGIFKTLVENEGLSDKIRVDSAGTGGWHIGHLPDSRMRAAARRRGIELTHRARQFSSEDFKQFDYILCMDRSNLRDVKSLNRSGFPEDKLKLMTDYLTILQFEEVPDPYYGGEEGFETVLDILAESSANLLKQIKSELKN